jgi:hypothetical protein
LKTLFRILAILLAIFILAGALGDLLGFMHHGHPPILGRLHRDFVPLVTGVLLLIPPKSVSSGMTALFYLIALFAVNSWYSMIWTNSFLATIHGHLHVRGLVIGLLMMTILWGTFWIAAEEHFASTPKAKKKRA